MKQHNPITLSRIVATAAIAAVTLALPVGAEPALNTSYPQVMRDMVDAGELQVLKQFPTSKDGLTGYIVRRDGYQTVVYSEDGYLILGPLYGPQGDNLSKQYARQREPKPDISQVIQSLTADHLITQGPDAAPTLYVFADPKCVYCHRIYQRVQPLVRSGRLQVQWAMVGVLGADSMGRAAAILAAGDPAAALARNDAGFDSGHEQGGIAPLGDPNDRLAAVLGHNRETMLSLGGTGTPTVVFQNRGQWHVKVGVPPDSWLETHARSK